MIAIITLLIVLSLSFIVTRVAAVALTHTGMSRDAARFQARSAFTGVGFTTAESESIVGHPVRRRIVMALMLVGNVGIIAALSSGLLSLISLESGALSRQAVLILLAGIATLLVIAFSARVEHALAGLISRMLRRFTDLDVHDYASLLHLRGDYAVTELPVRPGDWLAGKTIGAARLTGEGVLVLGLECPEDNFIGAPQPETELRPGDRLVVYGRTPRIAELCQRASRDGADAHAAAAQEYDRIASGERARAGR